MMPTPINSNSIPVQLVGATNHPDFRDAVALLRASTRWDLAPNESPEVVAVFQARPQQVGRHELRSLQQRWPLACFLVVAGSWCEGEIRTGSSCPGVKRLYWYEFPAWWRQQLAARRAARCPEWARPTTDAYRPLPSHYLAVPAGLERQSNKPTYPQRGLLQICASNYDTADAIADVMQQAGYATVSSARCRYGSIVRGAAAGIWDGGQLDDCEAQDLASFCRSSARDAAPVLALLDFPRRDRYEIAVHTGAAAVLGKPWINADLVSVIDAMIQRRAKIVATTARAA